MRYVGRRSTLGATLLLAVMAALWPVVAGPADRGFAQAAAPQSDEFNGSNFTAPFAVRCASAATALCPDNPKAGTWSVNGESPGTLRIWTQPGSLLGTTAAGSNTARNLVLQPFDPAANWTVTTRLTFPANTTSVTTLGQTAGLIVYQDDDNFLFVGRSFTATGQALLEFVQETAGGDTTIFTSEGSSITQTVYLQLVKTGTLYQAFVRYENTTYAQLWANLTPTPTGTVTPAPTATSGPGGFIAPYSSPQIGLFAFGGALPAVASNQLAADFDWLRVGNPEQPGPTAGATVTNTPIPTATGTTAPTATATPPPTLTPAPTSTSAPTPILSLPPGPTRTPTAPLHFKSVTLWYHTVKAGTYDHVTVQASQRRRLGIWLLILFPSGVTKTYYEDTDRNGFWQKTFPVPRSAWNRKSTQAVLTLQLWRGNRTAKNFVSFYVVR